MNNLREKGDGRSSRNKRIVLILRILVALGALGFVLWQVEWDQLKAVFVRINGWMFVSVLGVYVISQILVAGRWLILIRSQGIDLGLFSAVKLHFFGLFYNNAMISSVGGDVLRAWYVSKHTDKGDEAMVSVFVDRVMGLFGIFLIALFSYLFFGQGIKLSSAPQEGGGSETVSSGLMWAVGILAVLVVLMLLGLLKSSFRQHVCDLSVRIYRKMLGLLHKSVGVLKIFWRRPLVFLVTLLLTLGLQSMTIGAFWLLGRNLGIEAPIRYYFVIFPGMWVVGALPISIAGVGVLEMGIALLFNQFAQVPLEMGAGLSLCQRAIWLLASIPGAFIHLTGGHLPEAAPQDAGSK